MQMQPKAMRRQPMRKPKLILDYVFSTNKTWSNHRGGDLMQQRETNPCKICSPTGEEQQGINI